MLAYPQAVQPGLITIGPQWNAARSTHHRIAWMARESSKPGRERIERWTVQASAPWSAEHVNDTPARVQGKLILAFAEQMTVRYAPVPPGLAMGVPLVLLILFLLMELHLVKNQLDYSILHNQNS
jgi:predicted NAD/FAD-dependent oxidoreductase